MAISRNDLTKQDLIDMRIEVIGTDVYHTDSRGKRHKLNPCLNTTPHPKGIIGECKYLMIGWSHNGKPTSHPYHRVLYAWYNEISHKGLQILHIDGNSLNNDINNLKEDTVKVNNNQRKGAKNQYWNNR